MRLFIMRHGQADPGGIRDSERPLTHQGQLEARLMANYLMSRGANIDHIMTSPYLRAQQTADTLIDAFNLAPKLTSSDYLTPDSFAPQAHDYIDAMIAEQDIKQLLIVAHMPIVSYLTAEVTVEQNSPIFQTAAIAEVDYDVERMKGELIKLTAPFDIGQ